MLDPVLATYTDNLPQRVPVCGIACLALTGLKFLPRRTCPAPLPLPLAKTMICDDETMSDMDE